MAETSRWRLGSTALWWLQVITALPAGDGRRRHQGHQGGEGQKDEGTQHGCACSEIRGNYQMTERASHFGTLCLGDAL